MASSNNTIGQEFTDETYATRNSLRRVFGTNIDPYWRIISEYRKSHKVSLGIKTIGAKELYVVLTDVIKAKISGIETKLTQLANKVASLDDLIESSQAKRSCLTLCLNPIKVAEKVNISDLSFNALINDTYFENNPNHEPLVNYLDAIYFLSSREPKSFDENTLPLIYSKILKTEELTRFYRTKDWDNSARNAIFQPNPIYPYCPHDRIENLMDGFTSCLEKDSISPLVRAILAIYYISHIKPFDKRNDSVAALTSKWLLAESLSNPFAYYLPIEELLDNDSKMNEAYIEVQRDGDLTYLVDASIAILEKVMTDLEDKIADIRINTYREESTRIPEIEKPLEAPPKMEEIPTLAPIVDEEKETAPAENKVEIIPTEEKKSIKASQTLTAKDIESSQVGHTSTLSEKEVKEYVIYLMETEPDLNKKQASFYATHCIEGRYYTIQQFKEYTKCVYETARTSMDKLAAKGFYKKCALKNKFVYTPIKKRR